MRFFARKACSGFTGMVAAAFILDLAPAHAAPIFRSAYALPFNGGPGQLAGDMVWTGNGAAAVYAKPVGTSNSLAFYRMGPDVQVRVERVHSLAPWPCYEPSIAFDGASFGVAVSAFTQAFFLRLSAAGDILTGPVQLPGLPSGDDAGRTAAFKVLWTGQAWAVFGLWLERENPLQDLTSGNFYTHLCYWLIDPQGQVLAQKTLRTLAPTTYPSGEGAEKNYFDVAWTGQAYYVTYFGESESGPPRSVYYRMFDAAGTAVRAENPLFAAQVAQGPKVAWNGRCLAATALKTISMPDPNAGNYMYVRCFAADGSPLAPETAYGQRLGYGPTISWVGDRFLTAYCVMYDMAHLGYTLMFTSFDEAGQVLGTEQPLRNGEGLAVTGALGLGVDLQLVGQGNVLYAKAQNSDAFVIQTTPLWFTMNNDFVIAPVLQIARQGNQVALRWPADAAPFHLEEGRGLVDPQWTAPGLQPVLEGDHYTLTLPTDGTRFYRMSR